MSTDSYITKSAAKTATASNQTGTAPLLQVRVIAATGYAQAILADIATRVRPLLGDNIRCTTTTRPARRVGHVRIYLTVTRKEQAYDHGR